MIAFALGDWASASGAFFVRTRIYWRGHWTPFVRIRKRYKTWLGHWSARPADTLYRDTNLVCIDCHTARMAGALTVASACTGGPGVLCAVVFICPACGVKYPSRVALNARLKDAAVRTLNGESLP